MITDEQLAALDEAEKKATPGPCEAVLKDDGGWRIRYPKIPRGFHGDCYHFSLFVDKSDAEFIALSRNHMRELIDEVMQWRDNGVHKNHALEACAENEKLRAELQAARDLLNRAESRLHRDFPGLESEISLAIKRIDDSGLLEGK